MIKKKNKLINLVLATSIVTTSIVAVSCKKEQNESDISPFTPIKVISYDVNDLKFKNVKETSVEIEVGFNLNVEKDVTFSFVLKNLDTSETREYYVTPKAIENKREFKIENLEENTNYKLISIGANKPNSDISISISPIKEEINTIFRTKNSKILDENEQEIMKSIDQLGNSLNVIDFYKTYDSSSFYERFKNNDTESLSSSISLPYDIRHKFSKIIATFSKEISDVKNNVGIIDNVKISFYTEKNNKKDIFVSLKGFSYFQNKNTEKDTEKENFLRAKELSAEIKELYPSLIASLLLYNENRESFQDIENQPKSENETILNYEFLVSGTNAKDLFRNPKIKLNPSLITKFLERNIENNNNPKFHYEVLGVKADDLAGTLDIEVGIYNRDEEEVNASVPRYLKIFSFSGLRKHNINEKGNVDNELFNFSINKEKFSEYLSKLKVKSLLEEESKNLNNTKTKVNVNSLIKNANLFERIKNYVINNLLVKIKDSNSSKTYEWKYDFLPLNSLISRNDRLTAYPFVTIINNSNFDNINFYLNKKENNEYELSLELNAQFPLYKAERIQDINSFDSFSDKNLVYTGEIFKVNIDELKSTNKSK
ncbi:LppA-related lipoprotein [Mycoplasma sp. AC157]